MQDRTHRSGPAWLKLAVLLLSAAIARAQDNGQAVVGRARFTVITPSLIRLEHAPSGKFVDEPSWLAVNRAARFDGATITREGNTLTIDTGIVHLTYHDDGQPFSRDNLAAELRKGDAVVTWHPGDKSAGNLGGTLRTVDGIRSAVPLGEGVVSRDGWYLLDDSASPLFTSDWVAPRPGEGNTDWYFFGYGHDYKAALKSLTAIGGPIPMPRKYALGLWYSRYWSFTADAFKQIVEEYDAHGFPLDVMVMDMGWHRNAAPPELKGKVDTWTGYTWDTALIPDAAGLIKWMHERGLAVTLNDHPSKGVQPHEAMYADFMKAMGRDPATKETIPFDAGSKTYLDTFYAFTHTPRIAEGVDFWWLDWQQYQKTRSLPTVDNLQLLNWYNYRQTSTAGQRGQSFSRWAGWGDHRHPIHFSGDADSGWPMLAFEVPFTSTAGNVGCFFWSHDIGGHMGPRNEESYTRWCQFGALSAALRSHSTQDATTDRRPWNYPAWAEASMRESFRLRSRLMPYLYTAMHAATVESVPFTRPLYLDYPTVEAAYHNGQEYLFGNDLLVAPIATPGVGPSRLAMQAVWFPPGESEWFDFFTGEKFTGGSSAVAVTPIDEFPLYVRGGVPLAMQPYTNRPGTAPLNTLVLRCYPGRESVIGTAELYEDDGMTDAYTRGESATTALSYVRRGEVVTISVGATKGRYRGQPPQRGLIVELPCTEVGAICESGAVTYNAGTTRVQLPPAEMGAERVVTIRVTETPPQHLRERAIESRLKPLLAVGSTPEIARMIAAVRGVAVVPVNQHPYGLGDDIALLYVHNHQSEPESITVDGRTVSVTPGSALARTAAGASHAPKIGRTLEIGGLPEGTLPQRIEFTEAIADEANLARRATGTASTGSAVPINDGSTDGYPGEQSREWVTLGEKAGAWVQLKWAEPTTMSSVLLYDRPNGDDHVLAGTLSFSDGSTIDVGELPNDGQLPGIAAFPAKTCTWVKFTVTRAAPKTKNIGLCELVVTSG